ncbi:synaptic vesicle 2-related protein [Trichonephila clavipes]|uniref:Synaptic vesicle 2-related protein n=1 Tax=Trichonephila clavipes TaxID=2585209 RepID=A0A8X6S8Z4_TRICX|nr:synaptic vesicle 2-related protein [Trichonephila clavipes]
MVNRNFMGEFKPIVILNKDCQAAEAEAGDIEYIVAEKVKWYPESARYFLVSRQYDRAVKQLEEMLDMNKVFMPPGKLKDLKINEDRGSVKNLFKKEHIITTILLWYIRYANVNNMKTSNVVFHDGSILNDILFRHPSS